MKPSLAVCLVAFTLAKGMTPAVVAQSSVAAGENSLPSNHQLGAGPTLRKGIGVELPVTSHAVPEANHEDSLIVTVTDDGKVYFGADPTSATELRDRVKGALSKRVDKTLYVKADARAAYRSLVQVLDSVRTAGVERLTLLTAQPDRDELIVGPPRDKEVPVERASYPDGREALGIRLPAGQCPVSQPGRRRNHSYQPRAGKCW
jgi:biopolymer transport protein ExbD